MRRYIFREVAGPFLIALLILVTLLLLQKIIQITDWVVNRGVGLADMFTLVLMLLPFFLVLVIPMALLLATLLAVNRLSSDCEITAMKAGGIGIASLFPPVFALGIVCMALTGFLSLYLVPRASEWSEKLVFSIARTSARAAIRVKSFNELPNNITVYVDAVNDDRVEGVMIAKTASQSKEDIEDAENIFIFAREGKLVSDPVEFTNYFLLTDGVIHVTNLDGSLYRKIEFGRYDFKIEIDQKKDSKGLERGSQFEVMNLELLAKKKKEYEDKLAEAEMDPANGDKAKNYRRAIAQIGISTHQKFSLPVACLILALWGIPLGIQPPRATRYQGIVVSIALSIVYYLLVSGGKILAARSMIDPWIAVWSPNAVVLITGIVFLRRASKDKPLPFSDLMTRIAEFISSIGWKKKGGSA